MEIAHRVAALGLAALSAMVDWNVGVTAPVLPPAQETCR
jgi:hypothetical protein